MISKAKLTSIYRFRSASILIKTTHKPSSSTAAAILLCLEVRSAWCSVSYKGNDKSLHSHSRMAINFAVILIAASV